MKKGGILNIDEVMGNLKKELDKIENKTLKGMIRGVILVRRDMEKKSPKIPVDTSNLRASFFTVTSEGKTPHGQAPSFKGENAGSMSSTHAAVKNAVKVEAATYRHPMLLFGFSANYAWIVHEDREKPMNFKRPGSGAHFFVHALHNNAASIIRVIAEEAKI